MRIHHLMELIYLSLSDSTKNRKMPILVNKYRLKLVNPPAPKLIINVYKFKKNRINHYQIIYLPEPTWDPICHAACLVCHRCLSLCWWSHRCDLISAWAQDRSWGRMPSLVTLPSSNGQSPTHWEKSDKNMSSYAIKIFFIDHNWWL